MSHDPLQDRVYYSQNREDLILEAFFPDVVEGFYVDVGASDPTKYSVTKLFYDRGWHGINLEPIKYHFQALQAQRPRDTNLNIGIGRKKATLTFHEYMGGDGLSTFSSEMAQGYAEQADFPFKDSKEYSVSVQTLASVFAEQKTTHIHFLKVDVEGFEYDVLAGNDWDVYRPEVICIEANHITEDWRPLLKENGYKLAFFDGLNEYYADAKTKRQSKFNFVDSVVIQRDGGLSAGDYAIVVNLRAQLEKAKLELQVAQTDAAEQSELYKKTLEDNHNNYMRAVAAEHALRNPRALARHQARRLHSHILRKLTPPPPSEAYTEEEQAAKADDLHKLSTTKNDGQTLKVAQHIAANELSHLTNIRKAGGKQPTGLRVYVRSVNAVKRLRVKRAKR